MAATSLGALRLGSHQLLVALASGGMATLYVARKLGAAGFERLVAIKRVHPHLLVDAEFREMFRDEARVCSVIRHPNVVSLLDVVDAEGELFLVLDYVESLSLSELLRAARERGRALPPAVVARVVADTLAGLHAAHEAVDLRGQHLEVVHRDVSPQNILVGVDGTSRLIDFGIARAASRMTVTDSGVLKGKLRYMSPEQVLRKPLDRRADIFAAGVVLFEALTGRRLVAGEDEGDMALALLLGGFEAPSAFVAGLAPDVDALVAKALARERDERFAHASELQEALERAIPPASPREVGRIVEELGADLLGARRKALRDALEVAPDHTTPPTVADVKTVADAAPAIALPARSRAWALVAVAGAAAVAVGVMATRRPSPSAVAPLAVASTPQPSAREPSSAPVSASVVAAASAPPPSASAMPPPGSAAPPSASTRSRRMPTRALPPSDLHRKNPYGDP